MEEEVNNNITTMSRQEAIQIAELYCLEEEIIYLMNNGYSPDAALQEWDIYPIFDDAI